MANIVTEDEGIPSPQMGGAQAGAANALAAREARKNTRYEELFAAKAASLVPGVGHVINNGVPLNKAAHGGEIMQRQHDTITKTRAATIDGAWNTDDVVAGISPEFWSHPKAGAMKFMAARDSMVRKNFTATNQNLAGTPYGLVPFDLLAPSRLIYPVYTLFRNKFPRPAGQGASRQVYGLLGISGSQTGGQGVIDISVPELVGGTLGNTGGSGWPLNIPQSGKQTQYRLNVPYRFFGLSEALSWLAQFEGQGFEDLSALANLVLLQEMMLGNNLN